MSRRAVAAGMLDARNQPQVFHASDGAALRQYFPQAQLPASTWLGVQSLAQEGFLIEVDAIAVTAQ